MNKRLRIASIALFAMICIAFAPMWSEAAERDVEWGSYQNSVENNGVVEDIQMPTNYSETALKWGKQLVDGYTTSFTPPLIIDGDLIVASDKNVYRIDKSTGEIEMQSEELMLNVSYAINPISYDREKDQIYVPIKNGRIQCLDFDTLQSKWVSKEYNHNQSLSPVEYRDGMVYTGIWEAEKEDGVFFCLDADTGVEIWKYTPSVDGSGSGDSKRGFYYTGAYVNDDYAIVGSDDGVDNAFAEAGSDKYPESAVVYSFDRRTGEVKDRITGVKGDIRSSIVYHEGYVYFVSKGGRLYKAPLNTDGTFGEESYIQLKDRFDKDSMMTSTPVVYNGRIYVGAAGSGGQFAADGGHFFAVISDDATLSNSSLIYTTPISGYPQAAPLLSADTQAADGRIRLYFTFNAFPGGIYYLEDSPSSTSSNHEDAHLLFRPETMMQQYGISPLCCDRDGIIYYKNDSGYLMSVEENKAWLDDIEVSCDGQGVEWEHAFDSGLLNYEIQAPGDASSARILPTIPDGQEMTVTVDGQACPETGVNVPISEAATDITVTVTKTTGGKEWSRTYTLTIKSASDNANLAGLAINDLNTKPEIIVDTDDRKACNEGVGYDPEFEAGVVEYVGKTYDGSNGYLNIWFQKADSKANVRVIPVSNVGNTLTGKPGYLNEDGTIKEGNGGRYPIYWVKWKNSAEVDVEVTSASGNAIKTYHVTLVRSEDHLDVGQTPLTLSPSSATLYTKGNQRSVSIKATYTEDAARDVTGDCTFTSTDTDVAIVDATGTVTAAGKGEAEIWVDYNEKNRRDWVHVEVKEPQLDPPISSMESGNYTYPINVELMSGDPDAKIRYKMGTEDNVPAPTTTTGTLYEAPVPIEGTEGEVTTVRIKAIAYGDGYKKSNPKEYVYTIDLREGIVLPQNMVSPDVGSIYIAEDQTSGFSALPNGTTFAQLTEKLAQIQNAKIVLTPGTEGEGIDSSDPDRPVTDASVTWEDQESFDYYPGDTQKQTFTVRGSVTLPDGIDSGGRDLHVYLPVTILAAEIIKPTASPAPGTYKSDQKIKLTSATAGADIYYTISGESGTKKYSGPISLAGKAGEKKSWTIKAYATKNGLYSETVSFVYSVDRRTAPGKTTGLKSTINASGKKIVNKWTATKKATKYKVGWRKAGGTWKYKTVTGKSYTITGLAAGGCYEVKVAALNDVGQGAFSASKYCLISKTTLTLKGGKKSFTAKVKKVKKTTGCEIRYSLKSNMSGAKAKKTGKKSLTIKKLKAKKVYYVQAAPYKKTGGKVYMGQYIKKKIKTK